MSFGVGLGAFVSGLRTGYGISTDIEDRKEAKADRENERAWVNEQRIGLREDRAFAKSERDRALGQRGAIEEINTDTQAAFQEAVAEGEAKPGDFGKFWKEYGLPKMQAELLQQGDIDGAKKLMEWGESEAALKGGQLFAGALFKSQTGDHAGALDDAIAAGKLKGYIADDYDIDEKEPITTEDGTLVGYRMTIRDADGNETVQDVALDDIPTVIASFINPQAAWESHVATKAAATKREQDLEDYETKAEIDARTDGNGNKDRTTAIEGLRKRMVADMAVKGSVNFDDLPREKREALIAEEIAFAKGTSAPGAAPASQMIVDGNSGQAVVPAPNAGDVPAPGLNGSVPTPRTFQMPAGQGVGADQRSPGNYPNAVVNGQVDTGLPAPPSKAQLVDQAARTIVEGGDPNEIARALAAVGIDRSEWPQELVRVLSTAPAK